MVSKSIVTFSEVKVKLALQNVRIDGGCKSEMKKESSYCIGKPLVKGLLVLCMASQVTSAVCHTDSQCPGDQVCIIETHTQKQLYHKNFKVEVRI